MYFWQQLGGHPDSGWASEEWQVEDADATEVLAWAARDKSSRAFTLYVCCSCDGDPGLIRRFGVDPTTSS